MNLLQAIRSGRLGRRERSVVINGTEFEFLETFSGLLPDGIEQAGQTFTAYVQAGYRSNGIIFACTLARLMLFTEATFKFRRFNNGRPGDLFGNQDLQVLERPWPGATTGRMLARMEQDLSLAGNAYIARPAGASSVRRLRPDWVDIVAGSNIDPSNAGEQFDAQVIGYVYHPGGRGRGSRDGQFFLPDEVAHYAPIPDPLAHFRGMSWLTPVIRETDADSMMTRHKAKFFEHAATPNMLVKVARVLDDDQRSRLQLALASRHEGSENAYKTMILEGGADAQVVGNSFEQMSFSTVQAAGENRIAAAAGVPGIVVGLKEGLQAATYSNYAQAMRRFVDLTMRPLWRDAAGALATIVPAPPGTQLWYDDRDIPALRQDAREEAEIGKTNAETIAGLVGAGFTPESAVAAVTNSDFNLLVHAPKPAPAPPPGQLPPPAVPDDLSALDDLSV